MIDKELNIWSVALIILALCSGLMSIILPIEEIFLQPIMLMHGAEIWRIPLETLPIGIRIGVGLLCSAPHIAWIYAIIQVIRLARNYRRGILFDTCNTSCFIRIGIALAFMGVINSATFPLLSVILYYGGMTPALADISILYAIQPEYIMAGAFFYVVGRIMRRASALHDFEKYTI
jgi:hypothetical protein